MKTTYYAITSTNRTPEFFGVGATKGEARKDFETRVPFNASDIYSVTRHKNVEILSASAAIHRGYLSRSSYVVENEVPEHGYHLER